jgi:hypothetical protein
MQMAGREWDSRPDMLTIERTIYAKRLQSTNAFDHARKAYEAIISQSEID